MFLAHKDFLVPCNDTLCFFFQPHFNRKTLTVIKTAINMDHVRHEVSWQPAGWVDFDQGGNWSTQQKPSKSDWDQLKLTPHPKIVEGGRQDWWPLCLNWFSQDGHPCSYQPCPIGLNIGEQTRTRVSPWGKLYSCKMSDTLTSIILSKIIIIVYPWG